MGRGVLPGSAWVIAGVIAVAGPVGRSGSDTGLPSAAGERSSAATEFDQLSLARRVIDRDLSQRWHVEPGAEPAPLVETAGKPSRPETVRLVMSRPRPGVVQYRTGLLDVNDAAPGFRAPILDRQSQRPAARMNLTDSAPEVLRAARIVSERLSREGLLETLVRAVAAIGPRRFATNGAAGIRGLEEALFPVDWLASFPAQGEVTATPARVVEEVVAALVSGASIEGVAGQLGRRTFRYAPGHPPFEVADESGGTRPGLVRMQAGGGYVGGIVPGSSVDVVAQVAAVLPEADFLVSITGDRAGPFAEFARRAWSLSRPAQLTLVAEPFPVSPWAQDNGKAGSFRLSPESGWKSGTLVPRYASMGATESRLLAGESFIADGLRAAGHWVVHSPLLFQGGNLLALREPESGRRTLLVGEGEIRRNLALGLTREQVETAFRVEFGVDRCVIVPAVSYHLDLDVTLRSESRRVVAFVNDAPAAARRMAGIGLGALVRAGRLGGDVGGRLQEQLRAKRDAAFVRQLREAAPEWRAPNVGREGTPLKVSLARCFAAGPEDSGEGNLREFLLALDLLEALAPEAEGGLEEAGRSEFLAALRQVEAARRRQLDFFESLGWQVISVPSFPDLHRGVNYVNGVQLPDAYLMPVLGGLFQELDDDAAAAFRSAAGGGVTVRRIRSAECLRHFGGVHCATAVYPTGRP